MGGAGNFRFSAVSALARAALTWERLWPALWPAAAVAALFLAAALSDVLLLLAGWLHLLVLLAFGAALAAALWHGRRGWKPIDDARVRHRLERDNALSHRPLTALGDRLAGGAEDPAARALWRVHLWRVASAARGLMVRAPAPGVPRRDPWGLRAAALLLLVIAAAAAGPDAGNRLTRALSPRLAEAAGGPLGLDVWITPPTYTRLAPLFLDRGEVPVEPVPVAAGSAVLAQVSGLDEAPRLSIGEAETDFADLGSGTYRAEGTIEEGDRLTVTRNHREIAAWPLRVIADTPPAIAFAAPPAATGRAHLRLDYEASDDYGLAAADATIRRADGGAGPDGEVELRFDLPLAGSGLKEVRGRVFRDLTAHPWAGLPVLVRLRAEDGRGHIGNSETVPIMLPERIFNHPVARAIAAQRKKLNDRSPGTRLGVIEALGDIADRPFHFNNDTVIYLALGVARRRLLYSSDPAARASVQKLLWDTAIRLEDGETVVSERQLKKAQDEVMRALRDGVADAELDRLMDELKQALDKYMSALAEQLSKQGAVDIPLTPSMRTIGRDDMRELIERARELAQTGAVEAARQMLAELQRILNNLRAGVMPGQNNRKAAQGRRLMDGLRQLRQRQQELHDRTFRRSQNSADTLPRPGRRQGRPGAGLPEAADQEALRRTLGDLMLGFDEMLGGIPQPFGKAERAMRDAAEELTSGRPGAALPSQAEALSQLRRGAEAAAESIVRSLGGLAGVGQRPGQRGRGPGRDPFGRVPGGAHGAAADGPVKIPDQAETRRAREILRELHRRAGERQRPRLEHEYIDRLLRRF
ncbi:MAG: DUF4175 family protein [Rhodospirillales bacterium]|jgi:uncharacterized protein (TIGR02302 family)|nr:DUF4175 family protein [Rhodospirillales bacterium]MDP6773887.1 DUF4175 family protein [Rhodospirillales bacterium]